MRTGTTKVNSQTALRPGILAGFRPPARKELLSYDLFRAVGRVGLGCSLGVLQAEGGKSGMKVRFRAILVFASLAIAYLVTMYATSFTGAPLVGGGMEGTPLTEVVIFTVFPLSLIVVLATGNQRPRFRGRVCAHVARRACALVFWPCCRSWKTYSSAKSIWSRCRPFAIPTFGAISNPRRYRFMQRDQRAYLWDR